MKYYYSLPNQLSQILHLIELIQLLNFILTVLLYWLMSSLIHPHYRRINRGASPRLAPLRPLPRLVPLPYLDLDRLRNLSVSPLPMYF